MEKKVILKRIFHRDRWRIALFFDFDEKLKAVMHSISGVAFSSTNRCFYIDDSEENLRLILKTFKDIAEVDISPISWKNNNIKKTDYKSIELKSEMIPVASPDYARRDFNDTFQPRTIRAVEGRKFENKNSRGIDKNKGFDPVEFRISEKEGLLVIKFLGRYDSEWIKELRSYGKCEFDKNRREWSLQWSKLTADSLADYFSCKGVMVQVKKQVVNQVLNSERKVTGDDIRSRSLCNKAIDGLDSLACYLDENRYSPRTKESYLAMLEFFFRYFSDKDPLEITEDEISRFIYDYIIRLSYSAAYQNQMVSAIKMYYTISGKGKVHPEFFERPRRRRALPKVFSKEEVGMILNSARNGKHKLLLWMIYACGLRRSEVTNIKPADLDRARSILHIREGKGRVERIVPVSAKVWDKIDEYIRGYRPGEYLFEGQSGGRYSSESVYRVFKGAMEKAGIKKDVGVHSLRHSYATHLHENGLDIRYIQELLGHKSTRTTEIYTHVSRRNLVAVRSPIEDLDLK